MKRLGPFLTGIILGAAGMYFTLHYHVVRADDGFHMVEKFSSTPWGTYADIRSFGYQEWAEHQELAYAITKAGKTDLLKNSIAVEPLQNAVNNIFNSANSAVNQVQQQAQQQAQQFGFPQQR